MPTSHARFSHACLKPSSIRRMQQISCFCLSLVLLAVTATTKTVDKNLQIAFSIQQLMRDYLCTWIAECSFSVQAVISSLMRKPTKTIARRIKRGNEILLQGWMTCIQSLAPTKAEWLNHDDYLTRQSHENCWQHHANNDRRHTRTT